MQKFRIFITVFLIAVCLCVGGVNALEKTGTGFFYPVGERNYDSGAGKWLERDVANGGSYFEGLYHIGVDMMTRACNPENKDSHVFAIANGWILNIHTSEDWGVTNGKNNSMVFILHQTIHGVEFVGYYGHVQLKKGFKEGSRVTGGQHFAYTGNYATGIHLHFGISMGSQRRPTNSPEWGWGRVKNEYWNTMDEITGKTPFTNGFVDPIAFMENNSPYNGPFDSPESENKFIVCMETNLCDKKDLEGIVTPDVVKAIVKSSYSEDLKKRMLDYIQLKFGSKFLSDALTPTVLEGISYSGPGYETPVDPIEFNLNPIDELPDFVIHELILTDNNNNEKYEFTYDQKMQMHAYAGNIGQDNWDGGADDIYVRFYLSRGYKARNSDGDWVRVGTQQIKKGNLDVGQTNHEMSVLDLQYWKNNGYLKENEVYNIVVCVDRLKDTDNGDGEVDELHKSNNCSTEAVFKVKMPNLPVQGNLDIINCNSIRGWVKDPNTDNPSMVHVYKKRNNTTKFIFVDAFRADLYRTDVGNHGFRWNVPDSLKDGVGRTLYFYGIDQPKGRNKIFGSTQMLCADPRDGLLPTYRMYNPVMRSHLYTIGENEKNKLTQSGWIFEGVQFYAFPSAKNGTTPVYRFYRRGKGHFWTARRAERDSLMSRSDWIYEGVAFYVHFFKKQGTKPVYRMYSPLKGNHFYTTSWREVEKAKRLGYKYESIAFYAY